MQTLADRMGQFLREENPDVPLHMFKNTIQEWRDEVEDMGSVVTTIVTSNQLLDLSANPVEVISAPGPNKMILPIAVVALLGPAAVPYTNENVVGVGLGIGLPLPNNAQLFWLDLLAFLTTDVGDSVGLQNWYLPSSFSRLVWDEFDLNYVDQPVMFVDPGDALRDGDGDLTLRIEYLVLDIPN